MDSVGVRELRQNLSKHLSRVKAGESVIVTERGRGVARLSPSGPVDSPIARLVAERGARSLDAIHVATALNVRADLGILVSYDERLGAAARRHGLKVIAPA